MLDYKDCSCAEGMNGDNECKECNYWEEYSMMNTDYEIFNEDDYEDVLNDMECLDTDEF